MITKEEVKHIAKLARLSLREKEIKKLQKELSLILDYIEKLKEVNVSEIEPISQRINIENVTREDESQKSKAKSQKLLRLAPETKDGYLKIKSVF